MYDIISKQDIIDLSLIFVTVIESHNSLCLEYLKGYHYSSTTIGKYAACNKLIPQD